MGAVYARVAFGIAQPRVGLLSIGEEATKGNELTREAHQLLKALAAVVHRQRRSARRLQRQGRRDRLRRVHRQCGAEGQRRARRHGRRSAGEELSSTITMRVGSLLTCAMGISAAASTTPSTAARRCWASASVTIVGHGRSSAKAVHNAVTMAHRFAAERFIERIEREIATAAVSHSVIAFVFPGQGSQKVGMGRALAEAFPICRDTFDEADAALGEPLSRTDLRRTRRSPDADREHAAGDSGSQCGGGAAAGLARHRAGVRRRPQPRRIFGQRRRRHASGSPMRCGWCGDADATCRRRSPPARARWPPFSASTRRPWREPVPRLPRAGGEPGEHQRRRTGGDCGRARRRLRVRASERKRSARGGSCR